MPERLDPERKFKLVEVVIENVMPLLIKTELAKVISDLKVIIIGDTVVKGVAEVKVAALLKVTLLMVAKARVLEIVVFPAKVMVGPAVPLKVVTGAVNVNKGVKVVALVSWMFGLEVVTELVAF